MPRIYLQLIASLIAHYALVTKNRRRSTQGKQLLLNGGWLCSKTFYSTHALDIARKEGFNFSAGPMTPKLFVWIYDHKTLGKDKLLGQGEIDVCTLVFLTCAKLS